MLGDCEFKVSQSFFNAHTHTHPAHKYTPHSGLETLSQQICIWYITLSMVSAQLIYKLVSGNNRECRGRGLYICFSDSVMFVYLR